MANLIRQRDELDEMMMFITDVRMIAYCINERDRLEELIYQ